MFEELPARAHAFLVALLFVLSCGGLFLVYVNVILPVPLHLESNPVPRVMSEMMSWHQLHSSVVGTESLPKQHYMWLTSLL